MPASPVTKNSKPMGHPAEALMITSTKLTTVAIDPTTRTVRVLNLGSMP